MFKIKRLKTKEIVGGVIVFFNVNGARYGLVKRYEKGVSLVDESGNNIGLDPCNKDLYDSIINFQYPKRLYD